MKSVLMVVLFMALSIMVAQTAAICAEPGIEPRKIEGKYVGNVESFNIKSSSVLKFEYAVDIFKVVPDKKVISLKTLCNKCEKRETTLSGCKITAVTPDLLFGCKGETWHVDYQLHGDELKGNGISSKGIPFTVTAKKVQETEK